MGTSAITRLALMARGEVPASEKPITRLQLLRYCMLDTLAMGKQHEILVKLASA